MKPKRFLPVHFVYLFTSKEFDPYELCLNVSSPSLIIMYSTELEISWSVFDDDFVVLIVDGDGPETLHHALAQQQGSLLALDH